ncbi:DMT family transporter [Luedemannella helvata]|uniref:EamA family transporter n=1 Tax=Luedemannella helvata TaxID=349315 RepID=A0ABP4WB52_9ACTN
MCSDRSAGLGLALALLSAATFGTSGTFARSLIAAGWSAEFAVAVRVTTAGLVLAVPAAFALRTRWHLLRGNAPALVLFGLLAVAGAQVGFFNAVRYLPIGVALLLEYLAIILVVGWMWAVHGQRPRRLTVTGSVAAIAGLALVLDLTGDSTLSLAGVAWGLFAGIGLAAYFLMSARVDPRLPATALASGGMLIGGAVLAALGAAGALPMTATFGDVHLAGFETSWVVPILGLSLVAGVASYLAGIGAARILDARLSSFVGLTEVLFAILIAWLALNELPTLIQFAGGALIIAGVALVRLDELRASTTAPTVAPERAPVVA